MGKYPNPRPRNGKKGRLKAAISRACSELGLPEGRVSEKVNELRYRCAMFGITLEEYERLYEAQNCVCAICGNPNSKGRLLSVDHDHVTGKVRGLLCQKCNTGLGMFNDNLALLASALEYLSERD
jgi:hypothetical protein